MHDDQFELVGVAEQIFGDLMPIVAISAIALLRAFLPLGYVGARLDSEQLHWMVVIHLTFVVSGVLLASMDWVASRVKAH